MTPFYGYLIVECVQTGTKYTFPSTDRTKRLDQRVKALNLFSPTVLKFDVEKSYYLPDADVLKVMLPPMPKGDYCDRSSFTPEQVEWAINQCQIADNCLYEKAVEHGLHPPYPLFSAVYEGWASSALSASQEAMENSQALQKLLISLDGSSYDVVISLLITFFNTHPIHDETFKSACLAIQSLWKRPSLEAVELELLLGLDKELYKPLDSALYREWSLNCLPQSRQKISDTLLLMIEAIKPGAQVDQVLYLIAALIGSEKLDPILHNCLLLSLSLKLPDLSFESAKEKLEQLLQGKSADLLLIEGVDFKEEDSKPDIKFTPALSSIFTVYYNWPKERPQETEGRFSTLFLAALEPTIRACSSDVGMLSDLFLFLSFMHQDLILEEIQVQIYDLLEVTPSMIMPSNLYSHWAQRHLKGCDAQISERLIERLNRMEPETTEAEALDMITAIFIDREFEKRILKVLSDTIFKKFQTSKNSEEVERKLMNLLNDEFAKLDEFEMITNPEDTV